MTFEFIRSNNENFEEFKLQFRYKELFAKTQNKTKE